MRNPLFAAIITSALTTNPGAETETLRLSYDSFLRPRVEFIYNGFATYARPVFRMNENVVRKNYSNQEDDFYKYGGEIGLGRYLSITRYKNADFRLFPYMGFGYSRIKDEKRELNFGPTMAVAWTEAREVEFKTYNEFYLRIGVQPEITFLKKIGITLLPVDIQYFWTRDIYDNYLETSRPFFPDLHLTELRFGFKYTIL